MHKPDRALPERPLDSQLDGCIDGQAQADPNSLSLWLCGLILSYQCGLVSVWLGRR